MREFVRPAATKAQRSAASALALSSKSRRALSPKDAVSAAPHRFVGPRVQTRMGVPDKGWIIVTPVVSEDSQRAILVRRGWVPDAWRNDGQWRAVGPCAGAGVVTRGEVGNSFVPANEPEAGRWFTLDPAAMVCARASLSSPLHIGSLAFNAAASRCRLVPGLRVWPDADVQPCAARSLPLCVSAGASLRLARGYATSGAGVDGRGSGRAADGDADRSRQVPWHGPCAYGG